MQRSYPLIRPRRWIGLALAAVLAWAAAAPGVADTGARLVLSAEVPGPDGGPADPDCRFALSVPRVAASSALARELTGLWTVVMDQLLAMQSLYGAGPAFREIDRDGEAAAPAARQWLLARQQWAVAREAAREMSAGIAPGLAADFIASIEACETHLIASGGLSLPHRLSPAPIGAALAAEVRRIVARVR